MRSRRASKQGVTLIEVVVVVAILAIIAAVGLPNLVGALQRSRTRGTADSIRAAILEARALAIATGGQVRVFGFNAASGVFPNQFRIEGVFPVAGVAVPWPATWTPQPLHTATQTTDRVIDLAAEYPGIRLNVGDPGGLGPCGAANSFCIEFTARGMLNGGTSYLGAGGALLVMDASGNVAKTITVTLAGAVRVQ